MTVTEVKQALGSWDLTLKEDTPRAVLDALTYFGHVAIMPGRVDPSLFSDQLLASARYVGVYRRRGASDTFSIGGSGLAFWLGDEDDKGDIHETAVTLTNATFAQSVTALLPPHGGVVAGTINSVPGTYSNSHQWVTPRKALDYVAETFGAEYRVRGDAVNKVVLDAGTVSQLYVTTPKALLMNREAGRDLQRIALSGKMGMDDDVEDYTTRVTLLAEGEGTSIATGSADQAVIPYKDLRGNPVRITRLVSESDTPAGSATARAQLALNRFSGKRSAVSLSTDAFDIKGDVAVGDYVDVYDPDRGFIDRTREVYWEGQPINPVALRCVELTWPVPEGWTVAFRDTNGVWLDLSPYYAPETGTTDVKVGDLPASLSSGGGEDIGYRPNLPDTPGGVDATIPAAPAFGDLSTGSYQPTTGEWTKAAIYVTWSQPLNLDGSTITDGGHYEIRYRVKSYIGYRVRWGQLTAYRWGELSGNRWGAPITDPVSTSGEWNTVYVGWDQNQTMIQELTPGVEYELQIRAVDSANPPHQGPWSTSEFVVASEDLFAPSVPAAPVVASSMVAIQVIHTLGRADGGTFNLQPDLVYLSVHVGGSSSFFPDETNEVGKLIANAGMIQANIPAVGTFKIDQTEGIWVKVVAVDGAGNKSGGSEAVQATVDLIDDAHISDLTVSKVTAGTIMAQWIMAGSIKTAESGARVELSGAGIKQYNASGVETVAVNTDGSAKFTGTVQTKADGSGYSLTPSSQVRADWSINDASGNPTDHVYTQVAYDAGEPFGLSFWELVELRNTRTSDGGKLMLMEYATVLSHQPDPSRGLESYLALGGWPGGSKGLGRIYIQGKFEKAYMADAQGALWANRDVVGAGFSGATYAYGPTTSDYMLPICTIHGAIGDSHVLTSETTTTFTVSWNGTAAHTVYAWVPRVESTA